MTRLSNYQITQFKCPEPPPTKLTISTWSPSRSSVVSNAVRFKTTRLCSTATRRASISRSARSAAIVRGPASSKGSPFSVMVKTSSSRPRGSERKHEAADRQIGLQLYRQPSRVGGNPHAAIARCRLVVRIENRDSQTPRIDIAERHTHALGRPRLKLHAVQ